jgi:hypothetical protein
MAALGYLLNLVGGVLLIYYGDNAGSGADKTAKSFLVPRWIFYAGVVCFCVGLILNMINSIFRG